MGMFDTVYVDYPLPFPEYQSLDYQTKDLENVLATFRICEDGSLFLESVPKYLNQNNSPSAAEKFLHTGNVLFYTSTKSDGWIEWSADFEDGMLVKIKAVKEQVGILFYTERGTDDTVTDNIG